MFILLLTPPEFIPDEVQILEQLFEAGLSTLHVRKPNASLEQIEDFIRQFKPQYMKRLVLHSQYQLMAKYNIKGIHLTTHVWEELQEQGQMKEYIRPYSEEV
jgi:thiamine-phosphate pyrophosphorylase